MENTDFLTSFTTFQSVLDAIPHDAIITGKNNEILYANVKAKVNLFKTTNGDDITDFESLINTLVERRKVEPKEEFIEMLKTCETSEYITVNITISLIRNRSTRFYDVSSNPVFNAESGFIGRIWLFKDITEEQQLAQEKADFLSIASHQLRTPVTSMIGYSDMLLNGDYGVIPNEFFEPLQAIKKASTDMSDLINDLLNLSRIDSGKSSDLEYKNVNLVEIVNELMNGFKFKAEEKGVSLNLNTYSDSVMIDTDVHRLKETLKNLIDNAIKYGQADTSVEVTIEKLDEEDILIKVRDYGVGIPQDQQAKIFSKFFRANNVLTEGFHGTGIGLYYVKKCIDDLGGQIEFDSVQNQGTTFIIKLPIHSPI